MLSFFGEATFFVKRFQFCIDFINFLTNICVDEVVLKLQVFIPEKIPGQHYSKITDQEINSDQRKFIFPI